MKIDYENQVVTCDCGSVHYDTMDLHLIEPAPGGDLNKPVLTFGCCMKTYTIPYNFYDHLRAWMYHNNHGIIQALKLTA